MPNLNDLDGRILAAMSGAERLRLLLRDVGFATVSAFANEIGRHQQEVSYCINGDRPYPEIRDAIASALNLPREDVDRLIDGDPTPAPAEEVA